MFTGLAIGVGFLLVLFIIGMAFAHPLFGVILVCSLVAAAIAVGIAQWYVDLNS